MGRHSSVGRVGTSVGQCPFPCTRLTLRAPQMSDYLHQSPPAPEDLVAALVQAVYDYHAHPAAARLVVEVSCANGLRHRHAHGG